MGNMGVDYHHKHCLYKINVYYIIMLIKDDKVSII